MALSNSRNATDSLHSNGPKVGLLLVNHGSRSKVWRQTLVSLETRVRDSVLEGNIIEEVKTAFMEYTEPSIATRMKEFDREGFTDVIVLPIFLTISSHSDDDIPTILGQKSDAERITALKNENIECYTPAAQPHITPLLDFSQTLPKNVLRRCRELSVQPENEGLVLIGYGDEEYETKWRELFDEVAMKVNEAIGISEYSYGWCGHIVRYDRNETTKAVNKVLTAKDTAIVIPVLVAYSKMFQKNIIGRGIKEVKEYEERVLYKADSILPDIDIEEWVINISAEYANKITLKEQPA
ncbi:MAG TPA: CbiX/SirB N-terminal domain-containing protein [Balneolaceae bacterium]|nr:CbiX/SirB N-terminal domain-containing protein [Balneolaceae bacterium]